MTDDTPVLCCHCRQPVVSTGYNGIHHHKDPYWWDDPEQCRPTFAAPNYIEREAKRRQIATERERAR